MSLIINSSRTAELEIPTAAAHTQASGPSPAPVATAPAALGRCGAGTGRSPTPRLSLGMAFGGHPPQKKHPPGVRSSPRPPAEPLP